MSYSIFIVVPFADKLFVIKFKFCTNNCILKKPVHFATWHIKWGKYKSNERHFEHNLNFERVCTLICIIITN